MKKYLYLSLFVLLSSLAVAQHQVGSAMRWQKSLGGSSSDVAYCINQTFDGGYIIAGSTSSNDNDVTVNYGDQDFWIVRLNQNGDKLWEKSIGGSGTDIAKCIIQTKDTGYIVVGYSNSIDGNITQHFGNYDYWAIKLSATGAVQWQRAYGGSDIDEAYDVIQTSDNGFLIAGKSYSSDTSVTDHKGMFDAWLVKTDVLGGVQWKKSLGGTLNDEAKSVVQSSDYGFIVACSSNSNDNDVLENKGAEDYWIFKMSMSGTILWQKSLGGSLSDIPSKIIKTLDGNYFIQGTSSSLDGNVTGNHLSQDFWGVKIDYAGNLMWQKSYGGTNSEIGTSVIQTPDSNYVLCGYTLSSDGDVALNHGVWDSWAIKADKAGNLIWSRSFGGTGYDRTYSVCPGKMMSTVIAGSSNSSDGNIAMNIGAEDYWIADIKSVAASFTASDDTICAHQLVNFVNNTNGATNYVWRVNNINFSNQYNASYIFDTPGSYKITLIAINLPSIDSAVMNIIVHPIPNTILKSDTTICPGTLLMLEPGYNSNYNYHWSTNENIPAIAVTAEGTYILTVTNINTGCFQIDSTIVNYAPSVNVNLGPDILACMGDTITLNAGTASGVSYQWSTGSISTSIDVHYSGDFSVTATNINSGCYDRDTINIMFNSSLDVSLGHDTSACMGNLITLDAGYFPDATYLWSTGITTQTIQALVSGVYIVTVHSSVCTGIDSVNVTYNPLPEVDLGSDISICTGTNTMLDAGSNANTTYLWSTTETTQTISAIAGTYSVTATNNFGCKDADTINVINKNTPSINFGADKVVCEGTQVVLDAQNPGSIYLWSTGVNTQSIVVSASGQYSVTVIDPTSSCSDSDTIKITFVPNPVVDLGPDINSCSGDTVTLTAPSISGVTYLYHWSTGETTQIINVIVPDSYSVTVTSAEGCTTADTINLNFNALPQVSLGADTALCMGDTITIGWNCASCSFEWKPGLQTTSHIQIYNSGMYILKVTDASGCSNTDSIYVTYNLPPKIVLDSLKNIDCFGNNNGAIYTSVINGISPYTYQWSDSGPAVDDRQNLSVGTYLLSVTDINGCGTSDTFNISQPSKLIIDSVNVVNSNCDNISDGSIRIFVSGGSGLNMFSIDSGVTYQTSQFFQNLSHGFYDIMVKDTNGCIASLNNVSVGVTTFLNVFLGNDTIICNGTSITLDAGNAGASYAWSSSGETSQTISAIAGNYSVTVTYNGCVHTDTIVISEYSKINIIIDSVVSSTCIHSNDASIHTSVNGGVQPYTFIWLPATGTMLGDDYINLTEGTYTLTVTDSVGCVATQSATVMPTDSFLVVLDSIHQISCNGSTDGAIYISTTGGHFPFSYLWSDSNTASFVQNVSAGNYTVTVTDNYGCITSKNFILSEPGKLIIHVESITHAIVCGSSTGAMYINTTGGTQPYDYNWNNSSTGDSIVNVLPGQYTVTVTDINGCNAELTDDIFDNYCQVYVIPGNTATSICDTSEYFELSPFSIIEDADTSSGFIKSQNAVHFILNVPAGYKFESGVGEVYYGNGDIINASITVMPAFIDVSLSTGSLYNKKDTLEISGIRIKALNNQVISTAAIFMDGSSTVSINGISSSTVFGIVKQSKPMSVTEIFTFNPDSTDIVQGSLANCIAGIKITTIGNCGTPLNIEEFDLTTASSQNTTNNISEAKIFYTGHSSYFGAVDVQGSSIEPDGTFKIIAATPQPLIEGDNYFWLAYDIKDNAAIGDSLCGYCIKTKINGNYYNATIVPPVGVKRMINNLGSFISHQSGNWDEIFSWGGHKGDSKTIWTPDENDDVTINNGDTITLTSNASCANLTINDGLLILGSHQLTISGNLTGNERDSIRSTSSSLFVINDLGGKDTLCIPAAMKKLQRITLNRAKGAKCSHDLDLDDALPSDSIVLVLSNGALVLDSGKKILMNHKNIKKEISCSNSTYVDGIISRDIKRNAGYYIYPLGNDGECRPFGIATQNGNNANISEVQFFWLKPINYDFINYNFLKGGIIDKFYWRHVIVTGANTSRRIYYHDEDFPGLTAGQRDSALCLANNDGVSASEWTKETTGYEVYDDAGKKYVEFDCANASNDEYWTFGSTKANCPLVEDILPIELYSFDAFLNENLTVNIDWTTLSEINNDYFTIERAGADFKFYELFTINGAGNNYTLSTYHAVDDSPLEGTSYYRLKQTDFDGEYSYSDIRIVVYDSENPIVVFPNPVRNKITVQMFSNVSDNITVSIYDSKGWKILENKNEIHKGTNDITIDVSQLDNTIYFLRIDFEDNSQKQYRCKFIKG